MFTHIVLLYVFFNLLTIDAETLKREEEAIQLDGLNVAQLKEIREKVGTHTFILLYIPKHT